jgi:hypothetical protein
VNRRTRVLAGVCLLAASAFGIAREMHGATDFPTANPIVVVDQPLIDRLRKTPGLHLALAPDYRLAVRIDLVDDPENRAFYDTQVDLREPVRRRSIHIQRKGPRGAIHADNWNPRAGLWAKLVHGTIDVPVIPLGVLTLLGLVLLGSALRRTLIS